MWPSHVLLILLLKYIVNYELKKVCWLEILEQMERNVLHISYTSLYSILKPNALRLGQEICLGNVSNYSCQPSSYSLVYFRDYTLLLLICSA